MLETDSQAAAAGRLLGRFHADVRDLQMDLHTARLGVHDTERHLRVLEEALKTHTKHRHFAEIEPLAQKILAEAKKFNMQGTPGFLLNGIPVRGAYPVDHFVSIIDKLKAKGDLVI